MERTLISWNVPNLVTINLMAWVGFLLLVFVMQLALKRKKSAPTGSEFVADIG